jgi:hypothetical protein
MEKSSSNNHTQEFEPAKEFTLRVFIQPILVYYMVIRIRTTVSRYGLLASLFVILQ